MDYREQDSKNTSTHEFHPLKFAILASLLILIMTLILSYITHPPVAKQTPAVESDHTKNGVTTKTITSTPLKKLILAKGIIHQSFALAAHNAGLSDKMILSLSNIFAWDINFSHETQPGDKFIVLYDAYFDHGKKIKSGDIVAAEFINHNKKLYAIRYETQKNKIDYYTPIGSSLRRDFLRVPIKYQYISSPFNSNRMQPILRIRRPHEGVDLAANAGTPVHATSDGRITFRGRKGGYGKAIFIQNGRHYSTVFAHMSRFDPRFHVGSYVKEGQVIGYVGQTGLATGPHLHYEFHINGVPQNPMKVKLPNATPIPKKELKTYLAYAKTIVQKLDNTTQPP